MEHTLDVSELDPPEPLTRAIEAARRLPSGDYLRLYHRRFPCLLEAELGKRGLRCLIHGREEDESVEVFIWRDGDVPAEQAARRATPSDSH